MQGGDSIPLSTILEKVGLSGNVTNVEVSNAELFSATKKDGKWVITSHKAFTSEEWMKVTIDGIVYDIVVTDAIPGDIVTSEVNMYNGETKSGNFTITNGGVVLGPTNGTATISNGTVTNNAVNGRKGGVSGVEGSAFIACGANSLLFKDVTINSGTKNLVINIWANSSAELKSSTIDCSGAGDYGSVPFLLIGGYPGGASGTLNVSGDSVIKNTKAAIAGGNGGSVINVNSGTLTLKDSKIALKNGIKFVVKSGATLVLDGTVMDVSGCTSGPAIQVEAGGTLIVKNKSAINNYNNSNNSAISAKGATIELNNSVFDKNKGQWGGVLLADGCTVNVTDCTFKDNTGKSGGAINAVNGSVININSSTFDGNNATEDAGGAIWQDNTTLTVDGESEFINNIANKQGGAIHAQNSQIAIDDGALFSENHAGSVTGTATGIGGALCLNNCTTTIGSATFEKNGTFLPDNSEDDDFDANTGIYTQSGGAINASNGTLNIKGTTFKENVALDMTVGQGSGGAIHITGTTMSIQGATFKDNAGQLYGGAVTLGYNSSTQIEDLDGTPTIFEGNTVLYGAEFAGGAICIHGDGTTRDAFLKMENAAIYGNHADGAGGGISTCQQGTAKVMVMDGAAIFDNTVGDNSPVSEAKDKKDVYIFRNGTASQDKSEIYDRMFNGGSHCWDNEEVDVQEKWAGAGTALIGKSNPTNTDVSNAKVIFTGNAAHVHPDESMKTAIASGGAISNNGLLQIGSDTQIRIYKVWNDKSDAAGRRLIDDDFVAQLTVKDKDGEKVDLSADGIEVKVYKSGEFDSFTEFVAATQAGRTEKVTASEDNWVIDITGLPKEGWPYTVYESASGKPGEAVSEYYLPPAGTEPGTDITLGFTGLKNTYAEGKVIIEGKKVLEGRDLKEGEFEFVLLDENDEEVGRAKNDAEGKITFDLKYTLDDIINPDSDSEPVISKTFEYTMEEVKGTDPHIVYDETIKKITVTVDFDGTTELKVKVTYDDDMEFVNEALTDIKVNKVWENDTEEYRPEYIEVTLWGNDKEVDTVMLDEENDWKYAFKDLPLVDESGEEISYDVTEEAVEGYEDPVIKKTEKEGEITFTITNKRDKKKKVAPLLYDTVLVGKEWDDNNDAAKARPKEITVKLLADGEDTGMELKLNESNGWKDGFDELPIENDEGETIVYTLQEVAVDNYSPKYEGNPEDGFKVTNTYTKKPPTDNKKSSKKKSPKTGDGTNTLIWLICIAAALAAMSSITTAAYRKR